MTYREMPCAGCGDPQIVPEHAAQAMCMDCFTLMVNAGLIPLDRVTEELGGTATGCECEA